MVSELVSLKILPCTPRNRVAGVCLTLIDWLHWRRAVEILHNDRQRLWRTAHEAFGSESTKVLFEIDNRPEGISRSTLQHATRCGITQIHHRNHVSDALFIRTIPLGRDPPRICQYTHARAANSLPPSLEPFGRHPVHRSLDQSLGQRG